MFERLTIFTAKEFFMNEQDRQTRARLQAFDLDDASADFPFSDRLARENDLPATMLFG